MSGWIPTNELRFVEREVWAKTDYMPYHYHMIRVLQQKWEVKYEYSSEIKTEWRDVPVEEE